MSFLQFLLPQNRISSLQISIWHDYAHEEMLLVVVPYLRIMHFCGGRESRVYENNLME